jgi:hypothetical protein
MFREDFLMYNDDVDPTYGIIINLEPWLSKCQIIYQGLFTKFPFLSIKKIAEEIIQFEMCDGEVHPEFYECVMENLSYIYRDNIDEIIDDNNSRDLFSLMVSESTYQLGMIVIDLLEPFINNRLSQGNWWINIIRWLGPNEAYILIGESPIEE